MGLADLKYAFNKNFIKLFASIAVPVTIQHMIQSSKSMADIFMTASLGEAEVAAIGYGGRLLFVVSLALSGMCSGGSILVAQYWGAKLKAQARQATAFSILLSLPIAAMATILCLCFGTEMVAIATKDPRLIDDATKYIRMAVPAAIPMTLSMSFAFALRSVGQPNSSTIISVLGIGLNVALNYAFIFGHWGAPALGVEGAALATLVSSLIEAGMFLVYLYGTKHFLAFWPRHIISGVKKGVWKKVASIGLPLAFNSTLWAFGILVYSILVGRMGTQALAVLSMITPIESMVVAIYVGVGIAASTYVGQSLGAEKQELAWQQSKSFIIWSFLVAISASIIILLSMPAIIGLFTGVNEETQKLASKALWILAFVGGFRSINICVIIGILRAGGDQKFILGMDMFCQWCVGILLTFIGIHYWQLSIVWIFLMINSEEFIKVFICLSRYLTRKWMVNLTKDSLPKTI